MHFSEPASDLTAALALAAGANAWAQKADGRGGQQPFLYIQQTRYTKLVHTATPTMFTQMGISAL